jgi:hypothetical protein
MPQTLQLDSRNPVITHKSTVVLQNPQALASPVQTGVQNPQHTVAQSTIPQLRSLTNLSTPTNLTPTNLTPTNLTPTNLTLARSQNQLTRLQYQSLHFLARKQSLLQLLPGNPPRTKDHTQFRTVLVNRQQQHRTRNRSVPSLPPSHFASTLQQSTKTLRIRRIRQPPSHTAATALRLNLLGKTPHTLHRHPRWQHRTKITSSNPTVPQTG